MVSTLPRPKIFTKEQLADPYFEAEQRLGPFADVLRALNILPRAHQLPILCAREPIIAAGGGLQSGKTYGARMKVQKEYPTDFIRHPPTPGQIREYWVVANRMEDTNYEWIGIVADFKKLDLVKKEFSSPPRIILNDGFDTEFKVKYSADIGTLSGVSPLGILVCEAGNVSQAAFDTLRDRRTGYQALGCTYRGPSSARRAPPSARGSWRCSRPTSTATPRRTRSGPSSSTPPTTRVLFEGGADDPKIQSIKRYHDRRDPGRFAERFTGEIQPPRGVVFPEFNAVFHGMTGYNHDPNERLHIWSDPGFDHYAAVLFAQYYGGVVYVFDEIYKRQMHLHDLIRLTMQRPWWNNPDKMIVLDPSYAKAHHGGLDSVAETWRRITQHPLSKVKKYPVISRIDHIKAMFAPNPLTGGPSILIDRVRCPGLMSELGAIPRPDDGQYHPYIWEIDDSGDFARRIPEDKNNDALDALGFGLTKLIPPGRNPYTHISQDAKVTTWEDLNVYEGHGDPAVGMGSASFNFYGARRSHVAAAEVIDYYGGGGSDEMVSLW